MILVSLCAETIKKPVSGGQNLTAVKGKGGLVLIKNERVWRGARLCIFIFYFIILVYSGV